MQVEACVPSTLVKPALQRLLVLQRDRVGTLAGLSAVRMRQLAEGDHASTEWNAWLCLCLSSEDKWASDGHSRICMSL